MQNQIDREDIFTLAKSRVENLFNYEAGVLTGAEVFGQDLVATSRSDFSINEMDKILDDIRDACDKELLKKINTGELIIVTVEDYCNHMCICFEKKPSHVIKILKELD